MHQRTSIGVFFVPTGDIYLNTHIIINVFNSIIKISGLAVPTENSTHEDKSGPNNFGQHVFLGVIALLVVLILTLLLYVCRQRLLPKTTWTVRWAKQSRHQSLTTETSETNLMVGEQRTQSPNPQSPQPQPQSPQPQLPQLQIQSRELPPIPRHSQERPQLQPPCEAHVVFFNEHVYQEIDLTNKNDTTYAQVYDSIGTRTN